MVAEARANCAQSNLTQIRSVMYMQCEGTCGKKGCQLGSLTRLCDTSGFPIKSLSLMVAIEYALLKSVDCDIEDIQMVSAMIQKLHLHLYGRVNISCTEYFKFISSMEILSMTEPQTPYASYKNCFRLGSRSWEVVIAPAVFNAMRYVEKIDHSLGFHYREYRSVDRVIRATKLM
jgi:hypothetical protein